MGPHNKIVIALCIVLLVFSSCKQDASENEPNIPDFDRAGLLADMAVLIGQSYQDHTASLTNLHEDVQNFTAAATQSNLDQLRQTWSLALLKWQHVAPYQFGLAADLAMEASTNVYPTEFDRIENNISAGNYTLDAAVNLNAIGLQAIDYLIHGLGDSDMEALALYSSDVNAVPRGEYLRALSQQLLDRAHLVANTWLPSAPERADFIANDGTDQGSSMGLFLNAFNKSFEKSTRTNKLGIPAGALTFSMTPNPTTVEAYYENNNSLTYLSESINVFETIYLGATEESLSLDDYLITLDARHGEISLHQAIKNQIIESREAIDLLQDPLSEFVVNDQQAAFDAFAELQALVVLWKVDMMSSLSILITYEDTDGD